jgi:hypothetical protein
LFFALAIFLIGRFSSFCLVLDPNNDPPTFTCHIAGVIGVHYYAQITCWNGVLLTFSLGWPLNAILLISTSQVSFS